MYDLCILDGLSGEDRKGVYLVCYAYIWVGIYMGRKGSSNFDPK